jgi:signal transduction histidine kinase
MIQSFLSESPLLYYSHIPTALLSFFFGLFVLLKSKRDLSSRLFFLVTLLFVFWSAFDLILWSSPDSRKTVFFWSIINFIENLISVSTFYFAYTFLEKKDLGFYSKVVLVGLLLPFLVLMPTRYNISGFNATLCEAQQGSLINYFYFLEVTFFLLLVAYLVRKFFTARKEEKGKVLSFAFGSLLFILSFSGANIAGSIASVMNPDNPDNWKIIQYGLFGMPIFVAFLSYLIVKYRAFNVKLLAAQALVIGLIVLIGSQFFFIKTSINFVLTGITFFLSIGFGTILITSIKKDFERKEELQIMSDRLAVANQELKRLDNAKSEFISIASHQLRTPLTAIKGYTSLILEGNYGKIDHQLEDVINKIYGANARLIDLVENLLSISRLESGRMQYNFQPTQVEDIVRDLGNMFIVIAKKRGLDFSVVLPESPLPKISLDPAKIREVMSNLIDNAIKYTEKGSVLVSLWQNGDQLRYSVKDTGIGVTAEDKERLFSKFARSKETEKLYVGGTGLGLYVGKTFVEKHGGHIWVESDGHGRGSEFIFELPISRDSL